MGILVPTKQTSVQFSQLMEATIKAWFKLFGEIPKKEAVCVLLSQNAIETGETKYLYNYNIGNVKYVQKDVNDGIKYMMLKNVYEFINGKKIYFQPPHNATWFRAFDTLEEGLIFHLDKLKNGRFKNSWESLLSGNPEEFAHQLKIQKYYTASEISYASGMRKFFDKFMKDSIFEKAVFDLQEEQLKSLPTFIFPLSIEDSFTNKTIEIDRRTYFASPEFKKGKKSDPEVTVKSTELPKKYNNPLVKFFLIILNSFKNLK